MAFRPYINVGDFELKKKSSHLEWHKIFRYLFVNYVDSTIHCKININANVGDVETSMACLVCLEIGQNNYSYDKFILVKK